MITSIQAVFVLFFLSTVAFSCELDSYDISYALNKNEPSYYGPNEVREHLDNVRAERIAVYSADGKTTLSCVDSRSDDPIQGTPGGDMSEFALAMYLYNQSTGLVNTREVVKDLFQNFMDNHITSQRPFYFHTSFDKLEIVFKEVSLQLGRNVTVLPRYRPVSSVEAEIWLDELVQGHAQGHVYYMSF
jgi:hypothetical protein